MYKLPFLSKYPLISNQTHKQTIKHGVLEPEEVLPDIAIAIVTFTLAAWIVILQSLKRAKFITNQIV